MLALAHTPQFLYRLFPDILFRIDVDEPVVYLTFDDGPEAEVTPKVLALLAEYQAKATFFCVGKQIEKHPDLFEQIKAEGHAIGNHSFGHPSGWQMKDRDYYADIQRANELVEASIFRPPYGRMTLKQRRYLSKHYKIVLWDVLSRDFSPRLKPENCLKRVMKHVQKGSVVLFHDSLQAWPNLSYTLPRLLACLSQKGYSFEAIEY